MGDKFLCAFFIKATNGEKNHKGYLARKLLSCLLYKGYIVYDTFPYPASH